MIQIIFALSLTIFGAYSAEHALEFPAAHNEHANDNGIFSGENAISGEGEGTTLLDMLTRLSNVDQQILWQLKIIISDNGYDEREQQNGTDIEKWMYATMCNLVQQHVEDTHHPNIITVGAADTDPIVAQLARELNERCKSGNNRKQHSQNNMEKLAQFGDQLVEREQEVARQLREDVAQLSKTEQQIRLRDILMQKAKYGQQMIKPQNQLILDRSNKKALSPALVDKVYQTLSEVPIILNGLNRHTEDQITKNAIADLLDEVSKKGGLMLPSDIGNLAQKLWPMIVRELKHAISKYNDSAVAGADSRRSKRSGLSNASALFFFGLIIFACIMCPPLIFVLILFFCLNPR